MLAEPGGLSGGDPARTIERCPDNVRPYPPAGVRYRRIRRPRRRPQRPATHWSGEDPQPVTRAAADPAHKTVGEDRILEVARAGQAALRASAAETGPGISRARQGRRRGRLGYQRAAVVNAGPTLTVPSDSQGGVERSGQAQRDCYRAFDVGGDAPADIAAITAARRALEAGRDNQRGDLRGCGRSAAPAESGLVACDMISR